MSIKNARNKYDKKKAFQPIIVGFEYTVLFPELLQTTGHPRFNWLRLYYSGIRSFCNPLNADQQDFSCFYIIYNCISIVNYFIKK